MTDDEVRHLLKPKSHWGAYIGTALAVAGTVWGATEFLHSRASSDDTKNLQTDVFKVRLDQETMKGEMKAINVRLDEGFKSLGAKLDANDSKRRR